MGSIQYVRRRLALQETGPLALSLMTNIGAIAASKNVSLVAQDADRAMARLAGGSRINSATDDAAGFGQRPPDGGGAEVDQAARMPRMPRPPLAN